jgi:membrane protease YdiL (CAAX protease family)
VRLLAFVLLLFCVGALWFFVRNDAAEYAAFKRLTDTADRQRRYRVWALKSFAVFFAGGLICLALLHRVDAVIMLPLEFRPIAGHLQSAVGRWQLPSAGFAIGFGGALIVGLLLGVVLRSRSGKSKPVTVGDIQALIPRNWPEIAHGLLLSVNAGLSEELFFRLLLPLLFAIVLGNALLAFVLAALIFGFVHLYQGWLGIVATSVLGLALTALYLWSGVLWAAMAAHALLDMLSLVIRPALTRLLVRQAVSAS